jgi:release factor glutamine methyltransferase
VTSARTPPEIVARLRAAGCVFAEEEAEVLLRSAGTPAELDRLVAARVAGRPLEHLVGWVGFAGREIAVGPGVFVPRRRTELLVDQVVALRPRVVVELCCGAAAVAAAVAAALPEAEVHAADVSPEALVHARRNLRADRVHGGDMDEGLPADLRGRVDVLVANAPYVPTAAISSMPPEARDHEPLAALDGGADGLVHHRRIGALAPRWLRPGGHLVIETSAEQAAGTAAAMVGFATAVVQDPERYATAVVGILTDAGSRPPRSST